MTEASRAPRTVLIKQERGADMQVAEQVKSAYVGSEPATVVGRVVSTRGSSAHLRLESRGPSTLARATVGRFVAVDVGDRALVGVVTEMTAERAMEVEGCRSAVASIDLVGEIVVEDGARLFRRGVGIYPAIGDVATLVPPDDLRLVFSSSRRRTIEIGTLAQDSSIPAHLNVDDMVSRHFAVLGTTGVGKSSGVAVLLQEIMGARPDLHVFLLDGHNEYGRCFGDDAYVLGARNLRLPFWMFNFEETVDVIYGGRPAVVEEVEILAELIPRAKSRYGQYKAGAERLSLKRDDPRSDGITVDTPVPYLIQDLLTLIDDSMGRLDNRPIRLHYHRLLARIEAIRNDARYGFMFENANVGGDIMGEIIAQLFQLEPGGKRITVMQLGGLPTEVVDAVVCLLARTAFRFGLWGEGAAPILFVCEEAHRYAAAESANGFHPTRRALSQIAKEGRKYGVFLGLVSQRPAELDPTIISQCSTLLVMRMANDRDQALLRSAIPDAAANLLAFVPSLGTREVIGFGEGVSVPARMTFRSLDANRLPRTDMGGGSSEDVRGLSFVETVVERWRGSTMNAKGSGETARREPAAASPAVPASVPRQSQAIEQIRQRLLKAAGDPAELQPPEGAELHRKTLR